MLKDKVEKILNRQVEREGYSSNLYLAMASWAETQGYSGVAQWLYAQAEEEREHMLKFIEYINERDSQAVIPAFEQPPKTYENLKSLFEQVLEHEKFVSASINEIVGLCIEEKDYTTHNWIQWFVTEQIEEESSAKEILDKLNLVGERNLYQFDRDIMKMRAGGSAEE